MKLSDIKKAVNSLIKSEFPNIEIQATDVEKGFKRPSFFVLLDNVDRDTWQFISIRSMTVRIYYFPSDRYRYSLETMDVQDRLESIFNLNFAVRDRVITINETRGQMVDEVLEFEFDFEFDDKSGAHRDGDGDLMEVLEYANRR